MIQPREEELALTIFGENAPRVSPEVCLDFGRDHPGKESRPGIDINILTGVTLA